MPEPQNHRLKKGFIDEVTTYIPLFKNGIETLRNQPDTPGELEEIYRLAHIVCGAASLVGLNGLSYTSQQMENALEKVMAGELPLNDALLDAVELTVHCIEGVTNGEAMTLGDQVAMVTEIVTVFRRVQGLPESGDQEVLDPLLAALEETSEDHDSINEWDEADGKIPDFEVDDDLLRLDMDDDPAEFESAEYLNDGAGTPPAATAPEFVAVFYEEAEEHFETINKNLETLENSVTTKGPFTDDGRELIRQINRAVHTIKGASGLVGLTEVSAWAHSVEDLLDWLFEKGATIDPHLVQVLLRSGDILELLVSNPDKVNHGEMAALKEEFVSITETASPGEALVVQSSGPQASDSQGSDLEASDSHEKTVGIFASPDEEPEPVETISKPDQAVPGRPSQTGRSGSFRLDMEKLDDLVNLTSEQTISLSAFDQKLDAFQNTMGELELCRSRLREISRDLEVGYEVKAIQKPGVEINAAAPGAADAFSDFDALELDRYSEFNLILRALTESVVDIGEITNRIQNFHSDFDGYITRQRVLLSELQGKLMGARMAPMSVMTTRMRRAVREVSDKLGKKIRLNIRGEGIELDRVIWEKLADPLLHILRNAADHGIELPEVRRKDGKAETGLVSVSASREGNQVVIRIRDDGAGLDFDRIRAKAAAIHGEARAAVMDDTELSEVIFSPGVSTRDQATEISGRGVGLDVVKTNIEALKGAVRISSAGKGKGTAITVHIPLTLAIIQAIICTVGDRRFAVPLTEVNDILRVSPDNLVHEPVESIIVGEKVYPLYRLSHILGLSDDNQGRFQEDEAPIVLQIQSMERTAAFAVDSLVGQREIVIKSLGSHLQYVKGISGATVMGDGSIIPILNVSELLGTSDVIPTVEPSHGKDEALEILIVDDSVSVRRVVARLMEGQGWKTTDARDGLEALEKLSEMTPDLIVLDVEMPRMNGYEFLSARRSTPEYKDIPVVILTSRSTEKYREKARALGADGYIVKPFNDKEFISMVQNLTAR